MPPEVQALGHPRDAKLEHPTSEWQPSPQGTSTKVWRGASPLASHAADANAPPPSAPGCPGCAGGTGGDADAG